MKYIVDGQIKEISLKVWDGTQYSPDFFYDMEIDLGQDEIDEDGNRIVTAERYAEIVYYWQSEVDAANNGGWSEQFGDWREEHPEPQELVLFADEPEPVRYRYVYSEMTNEDLDGYFVELEFEADEDNHVNENALSVESFTQAEIEQDIAAQMEWGLDEAEAREYIMQRVVRV